MKEILKAALPEWMLWFFRNRKSRNRGKGIDQIFSEIHSEGRWQEDSQASLSGPGSSLSATEELRAELQVFFKQHRISSIVDLGCGDFSWFRNLDLSGIDYVGYDIVPEIVEQNQRIFWSETTRFELGSARDVRIGRCDLVVCRDCLVHLAFSEIQAVLKNLEACGARFVGLTHFPSISRNSGIPTGSWRPLNMTLPPFTWDHPDHLIGDHLGQEAVPRFLGIWDRQSMNSVTP